jgi:hypothetical protein
MSALTPSRSCKRLKDSHFKMIVQFLTGTYSSVCEPRERKARQNPDQSSNAQELQS